jgi:hypothetical protein
MYVAHVGSARGIAVLKRLLPYLICKRDQHLFSFGRWQTAPALVVKRPPRCCHGQVYVMAVAARHLTQQLAVQR